MTTFFSCQEMAHAVSKSRCRSPNLWMNWPMWIRLDVIRMLNHQIPCFSDIQVITVTNICPKLLLCEHLTRLLIEYGEEKNRYNLEKNTWVIGTFIFKRLGYCFLKPTIMPYLALAPVSVNLLCRDQIQPALDQSTLPLLHPMDTMIICTISGVSCLQTRWLEIGALLKVLPNTTTHESLTAIAHRTPSGVCLQIYLWIHFVESISNFLCKGVIWCNKRSP